MAALPKLASLLSAALLLSAAPAAAQMREAQLPEIFESYNDCFAATESGSLSPPAIEALGWVKGDWDKATSEGPYVFAHAERAPIILLTELEGDGLCIVLARIKSKETYEGFKEAFGGKLPKPDDEGLIFYQAESRLVRLALTGTKDEPSMSLAVSTPTEN